MTPNLVRVPGNADKLSSVPPPRRKANPKVAKLREQLEATVLDVDYCEGRLLRWANKLNSARTKRKRLERELAKLIATI